jgi:hypothetical protein
MCGCSMIIERLNAPNYVQKFSSLEKLVKCVKESIKLKELKEFGMVEIKNEVPLGFHSNYYQEIITTAFQN